MLPFLLVVWRKLYLSPSNISDLFPNQNLSFLPSVLCLSEIRNNNKFVFAINCVKALHFCITLSTCIFISRLIYLQCNSFAWNEMFLFAKYFYRYIRFIALRNRRILLNAICFLWSITDICLGKPFQFIEVFAFGKVWKEEFLSTNITAGKFLEFQNFWYYIFKDSLLCLSFFFLGLKIQIVWFCEVL